MKLLSLLYSFRGRIGRGRYWGGVAITVCLCALLWLSAELTAPAGGAGDVYQSAITLLLFILFIIVPTWAALGTKRLHDRNKRGWWQILFYPVPAALFAFASARQEPSLPLMAVSAALFLWGLIELGFLPGTPGENAYGRAAPGGLTGPGDRPTLPGA
jgi:uncharacterized membrane protein YhaH (DUF805 family)